MNKNGEHLFLAKDLAANISQIFKNFKVLYLTKPWSKSFKISFTIVFYPL